jgi:hypothetical protein
MPITCSPGCIGFGVADLNRQRGLRISHLPDLG